MYKYKFDGCTICVAHADTGKRFELSEATNNNPVYGLMKVKMPQFAPFMIEIAIRKSSHFNFFYPRITINGKRVCVADAYFRRILVRGNEGSNDHLCFSNLFDVNGGCSETFIEILIHKFKISDRRIPVDVEAIACFDADLLGGDSCKHYNLSGGQIITCLKQKIVTDVISPHAICPLWSIQRYSIIDGSPIVHVGLHLVGPGKPEHKIDEKPESSTNVSIENPTNNDNFQSLVAEFNKQVGIAGECNCALESMNTELVLTRTKLDSQMAIFKKKLEERNEAVAEMTRLIKKIAENCPSNGEGFIPKIN